MKSDNGVIEELVKTWQNYTEKLFYNQKPGDNQFGSRKAFDTREVLLCMKILL